MTDNDYIKYFSGEKLYGDDFDEAQIAVWYTEEEEAYPALGFASTRYGAHALNRYHGYRHLPVKRFAKVLGIGSSYGAEYEPVVDRIGEITILEASSQLRKSVLKNTPVTYEMPSLTGRIPFGHSSFDLITCFATLHHIPNVSYVMKEAFRVLRRSGYMLVREPIVSMGDWRYPRKGLTKHERGIPLNLFREMILNAGFTIEREAKCFFPLTKLIGRVLPGEPYNTRCLVKFDALTSRIFGRRSVYHPLTLWQKLQPQVVFFVLYKP